MMQVVATAGHVDHGKSALVRSLTGREPDRLDEERRRGLTIDLGYVWTDLRAAGRSVTVAFVDVPGHDRFLTNMLAGVGAVDEVLFVVAADDGWSAQSEEHLEIVTVLGRRITAAVVTKATPAGPARTAEVVEDVRARLARVGAAAAPVLAVDAIDGQGLDELRTTLVQRLSPPSDGAGDDGEGSRPGVPPAPDGSFPRLWVDRVFSVAGAGTVVTGTLDSGRLTRGEHVAVLPGPTRGRIRDLRSLEDQVEVAVAPSRVAVALAGVDHAQVERGAVLVGLDGDGAPAGVVTEAMDVWLTVLDHGPVGHRGAWQLHLGTAHRPARVLPLLGDLQPGEQGPARVEVAGPLPVRIGDRFVLREVGRQVTAAGGTVLEPSPSRTRRGVSERLEHAEALEAVHEAGDGAPRAGALVALRGGATALERLEAAVGQPLGMELADDARLTVVDEVVVDRQRLEGWQAAAIAAARERAGDDPVVTHDQLLSAVEAHGCPRSLWPAVLRAALASGEVEEVGGRVVHRDDLDVYRAGLRARQEQLLAALAGPELAFVDADRVVEEYRVARFELQPLLDGGQLLQRDGLVFTPDTVERAVEVLDAGPGGGGAPFTASDARQAWGLTRRFAVPLLEHLRATGRTTFDGTSHRRVTG
ncbi:MAG: selenocysteine-specific translation elongation factor [Nitriliruptor sp.]|nr:MAG: selenocysteine-specific translation elongation factor [Nitriliruptor sp.]